MSEYRNAGYKAKTIKSVLRKKVDAWLATITDSHVKELAARNTIVTGGSIASMLLGEPVNDYDIYFKNHATAKAVAEYYVGKFSEAHPGRKITVEDVEHRIKIKVKSVGVAEAPGYTAETLQDPGHIEDAYVQTEDAALAKEDAKHKPVFLSTNAITLSGKIQLILRFYGEPDDIHKNYDFVHCTNYWTSGDGELVLRPEALEALLARELRYVGSKYPLCSLIRLRKFIKRGWTINAGQIVKMCLQLNELDLLDISVLEDQLTGVDVAYFLMLLEAIKDVGQEKLNASYICTIIDKMF